MDRIAAADNLFIEMQDERWRLIANGDAGQRVLVEAQPGQPLRYISPFAISRKLPDTGALPASQIQRVVLGWSSSDEAWHLGLVLRSELAEARGSRWCEVASWPDPDRSTYQDIAQRAAEALANSVARPFYLVPPKSPAATQPITPVRPLPPLPISIDIWTIDRSAEGHLQFTRDPAWARATLRRVLWYALWAVVYVALVAASLTRDIAPVRPEFLPALGLFAALVLVGLVGTNLYQLLATPSRIVINAHTHTIRALRGRRELWAFQAADLKAVYVSQVWGKKIRQQRNKPVSYYSELNLQRSNGDFHYMLNTDHGQISHIGAEEMPDEGSVTSLTLATYHTDMQAVGLYMAEALGIPCIYDRRA